MNLYRWNSEALRNYASGDVVVLAESVEQARKKVLQEYQPDVEGHSTEEVYLVMLKLTEDEDYEEELAKYWDLIRHDLAQEPELVESGVIFIRGSD